MWGKKRQVFIFLAGSVIFLLLPIVFSSYILQPLGFLFKMPVFQKLFLGYCLMLGFFYLNYFFLIPRIYFKRRHLTYAITCVAVFFVLSSLPSLLLRGGLTDLPMANEEAMIYTYFQEAGNYVYMFLIALLCSFSLQLYFTWKQTERERMNAEILYLKAKIDPHFLFNTLNSIYALALEKSDDTPTALVKLSGMMRYVFNEAKDTFVWLDKEINYISDYIALQNIRLGNTVDLTYNVSGISAGKKIAPLVLIPFVENAFKYGVNPEEESRINIDIAITTTRLTMVVANKKVKIRKGSVAKSGHGITTTRGRLELLYPGKHILKIDDNEKEFSVSLHIDFV
jgi:sensor histidine kinase YesM